MEDINGWIIQKKSIQIFDSQPSSEIDSVVTAWLLHGMRITAPPQQSCEVSYSSMESGSLEESEPFCFGCGLAVYCVLQVP